jgi:hypothetical protein
MRLQKRKKPKAKAKPKAAPKRKLLLKLKQMPLLLKKQKPLNQMTSRLKAQTNFLYFLDI